MKVPEAVASPSVPLRASHDEGPGGSRTSRPSRWGSHQAIAAIEPPEAAEHRGHRGGEPACRRGSVVPDLGGPGRVAIHLSGLPGDCVVTTRGPSARRFAGGQPMSHAWPCSGWGLPSRPGHPGRWCALAAPFHPCLCALTAGPTDRWLRRHRRSALCCTFRQVTLPGR